MTARLVPPVGCASASDYDSRGAGWYCCADNTWNADDARVCRTCGHLRCAAK